MSIRENLEIFAKIDLENYLRVLRSDFRARKHPSQDGALIADGCPFYVPREQGDHISILGLNKVPLPYSLIQTLVERPDLAPDEMFIRWTQEQDLIWEGTLGELRKHAKNAAE